MQIDSIQINSSTPAEFLDAYYKASSSLAPDVRKQLDEVRNQYLRQFGMDWLHEHWNGKTVSEILAEFRRDESRSSIWPQTDWTDIGSAVLTASADAVAMLSCPRCGGSLTLEFTRESPQPDGSTAGYLSVSCGTCVSGWCADGLSGSPPWIESLGQKTTTNPGNSP